MDERSLEATVPTRPEANLASILTRNARDYPDRLTISRRDEAGAWVDLTSTEFLAEVRALAKGLMAAGLQPGDRVGLMSRTRYEWSLADFAIWTAGGVVVPIYETSSVNQAEWILADSSASAVIVETSLHTQTITQARDALPNLKHVWQIEGGGLHELVVAGADVTDEALDERAGLAGQSDLATVIYTSGTTGRPKGCELTHANFLLLSGNTITMVPELVLAPNASTLLFLPLAHVLARLIEVLAVDGGIKIGHAPDIANLVADLGSFRPTFLLAVPRVFEKIYNATDQRAAAEGKGRVFRLAARTAISYSRALDTTGGPSILLRVQHVLFDALVYGKLRAAMGGRMEYAVCGGSPLGERLGHFFRGVGIHVLEGYGLTETTAPTNVNLPRMTKMGTVGPPLPGVGIRIADDGEILVNGIGIFRGYRNNPEATAEALTPDGWLLTGDLGSLDQDGCLTITGRKKEIIVTAGGKNVAPTLLEDVIRAHPLVSQCIVVGDNRPYIGALLTIDPDMLGPWAKAHDRLDLTPESALTDPLVREHLQMAIDRANQRVSRAESVRKFAILPGDFTEVSGHLTPSLKLKRSLITQDFAANIDALYADSSTSP